MRWILLVLVAVPVMASSGELTVTTDAKQDAVLTYIASRTGKTVQQLVDEVVARQVRLWARQQRLQERDAREEKLLELPVAKRQEVIDILEGRR